MSGACDVDCLGISRAPHQLVGYTDRQMRGNSGVTASLSMSALLTTPVILVVLISFAFFNLLGMVELPAVWYKRATNTYSSIGALIALFSALACRLFHSHLHGNSSQSYPMPGMAVFLVLPQAMRSIQSEKDEIHPQEDPFLEDVLHETRLVEPPLPSRLPAHLG